LLEIAADAHLLIPLLVLLLPTFLLNRLCRLSGSKLGFLASATFAGTGAGNWCFYRYRSLIPLLPLEEKSMSAAQERVIKPHIDTGSSRTLVVIVVQPQSI
jgi:hypothetical protein